MLDFILIIIIFFVGFNLKKIFNRSIDYKDRKILNYIWFYHFIFGIAYWAYISFIAAGDAAGYYRVGKIIGIQEVIELLLTEGPGTNGMYLLTVIPAKFFDFLGVSLLFTLLGYAGLVYFYVVFKKNILYNSKIGKFKLFPLLFFLPNLHFWSAGLGKDTLCFTGIAMFIYSMQEPSRNIIKILMALGLTYLVRPHISVFLVAAFGIAFVLDGKLKTYQKIFFSLIFLAGFVVLFDKFMNFLKVESLDVETIESYSNRSISNLSRKTTGSSVDMSSYPYPVKVFTFLYRPLFFDINGLLAIVASFENFLLLILSFKFLWLNPIKIFKRANYMFKGIFVFFIMGALTFPLILGNLGIMLREKNMFIPAFLFICLWAFSYSFEQKNELINKYK